MASARAALIEIFDSIQGEGRFVGRPMVFVRVATCPIRCRYCDTPQSYVAAPELEVRVGGRCAREPNPVAAERVHALARGASIDPLVVSVTGGEPLVYPAFVRALGRSVRGAGGRLHLETAALDPAALGEVVDAIDHLSADYKLPETLEDGADHGEAHVRCAAIAVEAGRSVDVKIVLTPAVGEASVARALERLAPLRASIELVLQPVTPFGAERERIATSVLLAHARRAAAAGFAVRVIPQIHPLLGID